MLRCFHPEPATGTVSLSKEEARHLVNVRRARSGQRIEVLDGKGGITLCELTHIDPPALRVIESRTVPRPGPAITLVQALPKAQKLELILQKTTELGVAAIAPIESEHCESRIVRGRDKRERHTQILIEACKQSGNPWLPELHPASRLADFLSAPPPCERWLLATQDAASIPVREAAGGAASIGVFIGPEGDFSDAEKDAILETLQAVPVSLGAYTLRSETAALAAIASLV